MMYAAIFSMYAAIFSMYAGYKSPLCSIVLGPLLYCSLSWNNIYLLRNGYMVAASGDGQRPLATARGFQL